MQRDKTMRIEDRGSKITVEDCCRSSILHPPSSILSSSPSLRLDGSAWLPTELLSFRPPHGTHGSLGFTYLAVPVTVREIQNNANDHPDDQSFPRLAGQAEHEGQAYHCRQHRDQRDQR